MASPFPLHRAILENNLDGFSSFLTAHADDSSALNQYDQNGNTPLLLAVHFKRQAMVQELLERGADVSMKAHSGWSPFHESLVSGSMEIALMIYRKYSCRKLRYIFEKMPVIIENLNASPDFYTELSWKCSSWIPFVSRFAPSDTYKIWKVGCSLRVDLTLIGLSGLKSIRGRRSIIFKAPRVSGEKTGIYLIDSDQKCYQDLSDLANLTLDDDSLLLKKIYERRLQKYFMLPQAVTKNCTFDSIGKDNGRPEIINGYPCQRYAMKHFCYRVFHRKVANKLPPSSLPAASSPTGTAADSGTSREQQQLLDNSAGDPLTMTWDEYRASARVENGVIIPLLYRHEVLIQNQKTFKGIVFITQSFPRKITDFLPIFEVILLTNHPQRFKKVLDFIQMKLPDNGFPIRFEIPVFPKIQIQVSFLNYKEIQPGRIDASFFDISPDFKQSSAHNFAHPV